LEVSVAPPERQEGPPGRRGGRERLSAADLRQMTVSEFTAWLSGQTNKQDRPFQEHTIRNYADAARTLDKWMAAASIDGDFTACDTALLNRFFAEYLRAHTQGGTNTLQRNLAHLFAFLDEVYDHPNPYTARLNRYTPEKKRPATLAGEFIKDLLEVTGGGRARDFEDIRDHAIIRVFTEGVRRTELVQMQIEDLSADLMARPFARVVPLKGARAYSEGRIVPFTPATARAVLAYLRVRRSHKQAALPALWLGARQRGPMTGSGGRWSVCVNVSALPVTGGGRRVGAEFRDPSGCLALTLADLRRAEPRGQGTGRRPHQLIAVGWRERALRVNLALKSGEDGRPGGIGLVSAGHRLRPPDVGRDLGAQASLLGGHAAPSALPCSAIALSGMAAAWRRCLLFRFRRSSWSRPSQIPCSYASIAYSRQSSRTGQTPQIRRASFPGSP